MYVPVIDVLKWKPASKSMYPSYRTKNKMSFFSAFVLSTTQTSTTNKQEKTTIWTLCKLLWSSQNIFPIAGLSASSLKTTSSQSVDCDSVVMTTVILFVSWCFMSICLSISLSGVYPRSSPPLPVKSFCSSTIWCVTKEEQFYFFIGVQESEFSVCLMLLNILRLKESAWISQCVSHLLSFSKCYTHALVTSFTHIRDKDVSITEDKTWSRGVTR